MRCVYNAINTLAALTAHIYTWCLADYPKVVEGNEDDTKYRDALACRNREFLLLLHIVKAQKKIHIVRHEVKPGNAKRFRFGEANLCRGRSVRQLIVLDMGSGEFVYVEGIVDCALDFLEAEMMQIGI